MSSRLVCAVVFVVSALTLQLEFLQTRLFSFVLWHHFVYVVVTLSLLGYGAAGTILSVSAKIRNLKDREFFAYSLMAFCLSAYASSKFAPIPLSDVFEIAPDWTIVLRLAQSCVIAIVPYIFSGLIVAGAFMRFPRSTGTLYFASMAGSALGSLGFVYLISPLGGHWLLVLTCMIVAFPLAYILKAQTRLPRLFPYWLTLFASIIVIPEHSRWVEALPEPHKQFVSAFGERVVEYTRWNPISRIDVISDERFPPRKLILMDGDAQAKLFSPPLVRAIFPRSLTEIGHRLINRGLDRVLCVGAGGGYDVMTAYLGGARRIDAVEINPSTVEIDRSIYARHLGGIFSKPGVNLVVEDGRSFVRRSREAYDMITLFGTDSLLALSVGAYVMFDNYLYTREAFGDYLSHLAPDGLLLITRWYNPARPAESLRVFSTALDALRMTGAENPQAHVALILMDGWVMTLVKKAPMTPQDLARLRRICASAVYNKGLRLLFPLSIADAAIQDVMPFKQLAEAFSHGAEGRFYDEYPQNIIPVSDDSPFFYQFAKLGAYESAKESAHPYYDRIRGVWHIFVLTALWAVAVSFSLVFILLPVWFTKYGAIKMAGSRFAVTYFGLIGLGFMLVEMGLIQKLVLFLGHPVYSMAVTIPTLLIFAGFGSFYTDRMGSRFKARLIAASLIVAAAIFLTVRTITALTPQLLPQVLLLRILAVVVVLAPCSFLMGMPFPLALRAMSKRSSSLIPWAWAVNAFASVLASVAATSIAMASGFNSVLGAASLCYLAASISAVLFLPRA